MRWLLLIGVCGTIGCAPESQSQTQRGSTGAQRPQEQALSNDAKGQPDRLGATERQVREWLARGGYRVYGVEHEAKLRFDFQAWIAEGRKIPDMERVLRRMLSERDSTVDLPMVAGALGGLGNSENVKVLIDALRQPDRWVRIYAADALGELRDPRAVQPLGMLLADEEDQSVRMSVLSALYEIGDERALRYLKRAASDKDPNVSEYAQYLLAPRKKGREKAPATKSQ
jgi:hypothetical protein